MKVEAGSLLLVPGLKESDFADLAEIGGKLVKFIFYPYDKDPQEQKNYVDWAHKYGLLVKMHSGGVSRTGVSRPADADMILKIARTWPPT